MKTIDMRVKRDDLSAYEFDETTTLEPAEGQALLKIDQFAFTANNVTYAVAGEMLSYWGLFAAPEGWGRIPVWGFANVIASRAEGLPEGERLYGYLPMSTHLLIQPDRISQSALFDANPKREGPHDTYHRYLRCAADPMYSPDYEAEQALFRPLYTTSFIIDDFCETNGFFGAKQIIFASASSKTAIGAAFLLNRRAGRDFSVVGLTSAGNKSFVEGLGVYDQVLTYEEISSLKSVASAYIDMSGSADIARKVHTHLGELVQRSTIVGITHYDERGDMNDLPGAKPEMFFAPSLIADRVKDWGPEGFEARLSKAWDSFIKPRVDWLTVIESRGQLAVSRAYRRVLNNEAHPSEGHILTLWND